MLRIKTLIIVLLITIGISVLFANPVPRETIVAEFDGGKILSGDIDDRIAKIPPMYQTKYKTEDGTKSLLDMMCTEEVFYLEALAMDLDNSANFKEHSEMQIKSLLYNEYRNDLLAENIVLTDEEKQEYFRIHSEDTYAGRIFEEVAADVENRLKTKKNQDFLDEYYLKLVQNYNIVINEAIVQQIDLDQPENNENILQEKIIISSEPRIEREVSYLLAIYPELTPQQKALLKDPEKLLDFVNDMAQTWSFAFEAIEKGYQEQQEYSETIEQIKRNVLLRSVYNILVVEAIDISEENAREYYQLNIEDYSSKATREIQVFAFAEEKQAKKFLKKAKKALKKGKLDDLKTLVNENCTYTANDGIIGNIYNNGIIPGFGKDENFAQLIWADPSDEFSKEFTGIFQNNKAEFVFLRIVEDNPAQPQPFEDVSETIKSKLNKDLTRKQFEETTSVLKDKYNVVTYDDRLFAILTAEEYFNLAEEAQKKRRYQDAIYYYEKVIKNHKNQTDDYKALFMKAFLYAEEIDKKEVAIELFNELIDNFPESDLHESARFMVMELEGNSNIIESFESDE